MLSNINFNLNPYYDDFDESKGYFRILFKPGFAVQARELTQLQTQLQNQISKFGDHIFKDGSMVLGGNFYFSSIFYIIVSRDNAIENFDDQVFTGQTSGARGKVIKTEIINDETAKVYFTYINGLLFQRDEVIVCDNSNTESIADIDNFLGTATSFTVDDSVFYVYGNFVFCNAQTIIIAEDESATCRVGLLAEESITTPNQDTSLLDPALGSYNYSAPGADRYTITLELISFAYDPSVDSEEENASENFIELTRFVDGQQVTINKLPIYSEIEKTFARRTYDESGDYTVRAFNIKVLDHIYGNTDLLSIQIEPGKAYVKGYEFETIAPTYLDLPRARSTVEENEFPVFVNYGQYLLIEKLGGGVLDFTANPVITLKEDSDIIGNCRVKYLEYDSERNSQQVYRLYIDTVNIFDSANISIANVTTVNATSFTANVSSNSYSGDIVIQGNDSPSYIIEIPKDYVASVNSSETSYQTITKFSNDATFTSNGTVAVTGSYDNSAPGNPGNQVLLGSGLLNESDTRELFTVVVATNPSADPSIPVGTVLDYDTHQLRITIVDEDTVQMSTNTANSFTAAVFAKVSVSGAIRKLKTLQTGNVTISGASLTTANLSGTISLLKSDCIELSSVIAVDNTSAQYDYTNHYEFNNGQTDVLYDHGFITLKPGYPDPISADTSANIQSVVVSFTYFTHSGLNSGFFNVDSYGAISYDQIPLYTSSTGKVFDLKNCFDFRPRRTDNSTSVTGRLLAEPSSVLTTDFEHYVGRIDKLVVTKERRFTLIQGISDINPQTPVDIPDSMNLYVLTIPAYTKNKDEVTYSFIENRRYTMRDIGKIEKRVERLEYYTALSLLEKQASDESIPSDVPTVDRFKNGILVDSFAGHSVGDVSNPDYRCSIDYRNRVLRPSFASDCYTFTLNTGESSNYNKSGDLLSLNYTTETFVNQPLASRTVNLNPYNVFVWNGFMDLEPSSDNWVDTTVKPDVVVNLNGENDVYTVLANNVNNPASVGVRWEDWQTIVNGVPQSTNKQSTSTAVSTATSGGKVLQTTTATTTSTQTTTVTDQLARVGLEISTGAVQTVTRDLGTKVVDTSIIPFIRSRVITFSARALKPTTELYALFDGIDVTNYCYPATEINLATGNTVNQNAQSIVLTSNNAITAEIIATRPGKIFVRERNGLFQANNNITWIVNGVNSGTAVVSSVTRRSALITNEFGDIAGSFLIPNNDLVRFRTGERTFKLADTVGDGATTAAATKYVAQGLSQSVERTLVATRVSTVSINPVFEVRAATTSTSTTSVSSSSNTVDITPPPPPPPPPPPVVACAHNENGGNQGTFNYTIEFGSNTGICGISYDAFQSIPDRFTIIWDGNEYTSGFVGGTSYNAQLRSLGFPEVVGGRTGQLTFNKTKSTPTRAQLRVDAPIRGTAWKYKVICPGQAVTPPTPITTGSIDLVLNSASTVTFSFAERNTATLTNNVKINVETSGNPASFIRVSNLAVSVVDDRGVAVTGVTLSSSTVDITTTLKSSSTNRRTGESSVNIVFPKPLRDRSSYTVTITGIARAYNTIVDRTNGTNIVLTSSTATGRTVVSRNDTQGRPVDPVAQTFFVDADQYPNGIFLESIDLYFRTKAVSLPVTVELRPTVNGYPSSRDIVPFSVVNLVPSQVAVSNNGSVPTNFKFRSPIYLPPGEHCFVAKCDTTEYTVYTAVIGEFLLTDSKTRITEQPAVGSMFKSQNSSTWTPVQEEDVKFKLNKCVFSTNIANSASIVLNTNFPTNGNVVYDNFFADGEVLDFAATNINYFYKTTDLENTQLDATFTPYQLGSNVPMPSRRILRSGQGNDLQFSMIMTTVDRNVTPVVDLARLSTVLVQNNINNAGLSKSNFLISNYGEGYTGNANVTISSTTGSGAEAVAVYNANTGRLEIEVINPGAGYTGEITATIDDGGTATSNAEVIVQNEIGTLGGNSIARYITRKVTLAPGFESLDLKTYFLANIPSGTSVKVYYKVAPIASTFFDIEPWREMIVESSGSPSETGFVDYKYKTITDTALPSGERFKTFSIKIVMLSSNPTRVPQIKDLRVIALDD